MCICVERLGTRFSTSGSVRAPRFRSRRPATLPAKNSSAPLLRRSALHDRVAAALPRCRHWAAVTPDQSPRPRGNQQPPPPPGPPSLHPGCRVPLPRSALHGAAAEYAAFWLETFRPSSKAQCAPPAAREAGGGRVRWRRRPLRRLSLSLSLLLYLSLSLSVLSPPPPSLCALSLPPSVSLSLYRCLSLSLSPSLSIYLSLTTHSLSSFSLSLSPSRYLSLPLALSLSFSLLLTLCTSLSLSPPLSVYLSFSLSPALNISNISSPSLSLSLLHTIPCADNERPRQFVRFNSGEAVNMRPGPAGPRPNPKPSNAPLACPGPAMASDKTSRLPYLTSTLAASSSAACPSGSAARPDKATVIECFVFILYYRRQLHVIICTFEWASAFSTTTENRYISTHRALPSRRRADIPEWISARVPDWCAAMTTRLSPVDGSEIPPNPSAAPPLRRRVLPPLHSFRSNSDVGAGVMLPAQRCVSASHRPRTRHCTAASRRPFVRVGAGATRPPPGCSKPARPPSGRRKHARQR